MTKLSILIAEDENLIAEELRDRLQRMGFAVAAVVASGEEAIAGCGEKSPALVLMDIRLKGDLDGIVAAETIRERFDIPVVFLTAHSDGATVDRAKRTGPFGYLLKPFAERELRLTIEMALNGHAVEQRLKESEQRYATTLTSIGDAVISTDTEGRINFMNRVAEALTQWRQEEALGLPLETVFRIVNATTRAVPESIVAKALREGKAVKMVDDTVLIAKDGTEIPIDDSAALVCDAQRQIHGVVLVFSDISDRRRQEAALRKTEEQLRQAQKMEVLGRLAGGVAHNINNLMTVVTGYAELVFSELPPESPLRRMVKAMKEAGDRSATITRQLLAFSRKQVLMPVVVSLNDVVNALEEVLRSLIGEDVEVACHLEPDLGRVKVDRNEIELAIMNLAVNARDAMPQGGKLTLETRNVFLDEPDARGGFEVQPGRYVMLAVTDTGCGMDAHIKAHLFEPFFTTKEIGKGTGLGLATAYGIVKQSGGHILVNSESGEGATFKIYLPEVMDTASPHATPEPIELLSGTETVLVVEDDDSVRRFTRSVLQRSGYVVLEAADAAAAQQVCKEHSGTIHLLLSDVVMPRLSGRVLAERLTHLRPGIKVLFMSGHTEDHMVRHGVLTAQVAFLPKPFSAYALTRKVREVLDQSP